MREIGIDISGHHSKHMNEFLERDVETVITVCGNADQACPMFPGQVNRHHWGFDDPAHATGTEAEQLAVFRRVRDEIRRVFDAYGAGRRDQLAASNQMAAKRRKTHKMKGIVQPILAILAPLCGYTFRCGFHSP
jgi:arsenate reductase